MDLFPEREHILLQMGINIQVNLKITNITVREPIHLQWTEENTLASGLVVNTTDTEQCTMRMGPPFQESGKIMSI